MHGVQTRESEAGIKAEHPTHARSAKRGGPSIGEMHGRTLADEAFLFQKLPKAPAARDPLRDESTQTCQGRGRGAKKTFLFEN